MTRVLFDHICDKAGASTPNEVETVIAYLRTLLYLAENGEDAAAARYLKAIETNSDAGLEAGDKDAAQNWLDPEKRRIQIEKGVAEVLKKHGFRDPTVEEWQKAFS